MMIIVRKRGFYARCLKVRWGLKGATCGIVGCKIARTYFYARQTLRAKFPSHKDQTKKKAKKTPSIFLPRTVDWEYTVCNKADKVVNWARALITYTFSFPYHIWGKGGKTPGK